VPTGEVRLPPLPNTRGFRAAISSAPPCPARPGIMEPLGKAAAVLGVVPGQLQPRGLHLRRRQAEALRVAEHVVCHPADLEGQLLSRPGAFA
jgi:hypothetical protein